MQYLKAMMTAFDVIKIYSIANLQRPVSLMLNSKNSPSLSGSSWMKSRIAIRWASEGFVNNDQDEWV